MPKIVESLRSINFKGFIWLEIKKAMMSFYEIINSSVSIEIK
jgi:hypothetical protein